MRQAGVAEFAEVVVRRGHLVTPTMRSMTVASAALMAQAIPALLVAGLLGPLVLGFKIEWPERFLFASQVISIVAAEAVKSIGRWPEQAAGN